MLHEHLVVDGVYLPLFLLFLAVGALAYMLVRIPLRRLGAYRYFWHPALAGAALYTLIVAGLILVFGP